MIQRLNNDPGHDSTFNLNNESGQDSGDNFPNETQIMNNISRVRGNINWALAAVFPKKGFQTSCLTSKIIKISSMI